MFLSFLISEAYTCIHYLCTVQCFIGFSNIIKDSVCLSAWTNILNISDIFFFKLCLRINTVKIIGAAIDFFFDFFYWLFWNLHDFVLVFYTLWKCSDRNKLTKMYSFNIFIWHPFVDEKMTIWFNDFFVHSIYYTGLKFTQKNLPTCVGNKFDFH